MRFDLMLFSFGYVLGLHGASLNSDHPSARAGFEHARRELARTSPRERSPH
jgi:hypothetical protein